MPFDKNTKPMPRPQDANAPLSEHERWQLSRLLSRRGITLEQAEAEAAEQRKLEAHRAALVAKEEKLSARLAQLQSDIDAATEKLGDMSSNGSARRHVAAKLQEFAKLAPRQSFFNTEHDALDAEMIEQIASLALEMYERAAIPGRLLGLPSLRERMGAANIPTIGPGPPQSASGTEATAQAILAAGRRRRNEEP